MDTTGWHLEVDTTGLEVCHLVEQPTTPPADNEVLVALEHLALTANTMTYATLGDTLGYWSLFPASRAGRGHVPAWGHGRIVQSRIEGLAVGTRLFGLFPMATHCTLHGRPSRLGLRETSEWRQGINPVYNQYIVQRDDDAADTAELRSVLHPLFITSFVLAETWGSHPGFANGEGELVFVSASSKTALGSAACSRHAQRCVGLTSARHVDWVKGVGAYDSVWSYDEIARLAELRHALVVDFSGDTHLTDRLRSALENAWAGTLRVGATHTGRLDAAAPSDPLTRVFSGPETIGRLVREWGPEVFDQRLQASLAGFITTLRPHTTLHHVDGAPALVEAWGALRRGATTPAQLLIARPNHGHTSSLRRTT